jgi:membrane protein implicated in regulation of membrane protease activity
MADMVDQVFPGGMILTMELSCATYAGILSFRIWFMWLSWMITAIMSVRAAWSILRVFEFDVKEGQ